MKRPALLFDLCFLLWICCGCAGGPVKPVVIDSKITFNPVTGLATLSLPKDASWTWLSFDQSIVMTNRWTNHISLVISNGVFKNNPLVLDAQGAANVALINALGAIFQNAVAAGAAGATKAAVP